MTATQRDGRGEQGRGKVGAEMSSRQGRLATDGSSRRKLGRKPGQKPDMDPPSGLPEKNHPAHTLTLNFWLLNCERISIFCHPVRGNFEWQPSKLMRGGETVKMQLRRAVTAVTEYHQIDKRNSLFVRDSHRASWQQPGLLVWDDCKKSKNQEVKQKKNKKDRTVFSSHAV